MKSEHLQLNDQEFWCINNSDVITAGVSDHHPLVHNGVLFWNIMMQGKIRGNSFNNGLGVVETDKVYLHRLEKVANVIAEILCRNPSIEIISINEGPVKQDHVRYFLSAIKQFAILNNFIGSQKTSFYTPDKNTLSDARGVMMLAHKSYKIKEEHVRESISLKNMNNRFQLWQLEKDNQKKWFALAHFPFANDESKTEKDALSYPGLSYCYFVFNLLEKFSHTSFVFCADYNLNPYFTCMQGTDLGNYIPANNSRLYLTSTSKKDVTVDGILLSRFEKQKYYSQRSIPFLFTPGTVTESLEDSEEQNDKQLALMTSCGSK